nr:unnamed protein product [Spirometra erinaceieuropaei]
MGHISNFDAFEIVSRGDDQTRLKQEAWMSTDCSVNRHINLSLPLADSTGLLNGNSHGAGQSELSTISAADEGGAIQVTVTCASDASTQAAVVGHIRRAVRTTSQSLKVGERSNYSKRRTANKPLLLNASSSDTPPGNLIFTTIDITS